MSIPKATILIQHPFLPDGILPRWTKEFATCEFVDARQADVLDRQLKNAAVVYGLLPVGRLGEAAGLKWIQLLSAGVPQDLCAPAKGRGIAVTNLAGLYGPSIAEHALALMLMLSRNLHVVIRNQQQRRWDHDVMNAMVDLHGKTLAIVGLGNIGQNIARLGKAFGMRVFGVRRTPRITPYLDRVYPLADLHEMLGESDYVAVAAPLTRETEGMLGAAEFKAMKRGAIFINVSRGQVAREADLVAALQSGHLAGAGIDAYHTEPLPSEHSLWALPNVVISPHYSGETVNFSALPAERFARNLRAWLTGRPLEGVVNLDLGY
jgi:phosphoglycerate dehydrogenase-like enzyme